MATNAYAYLYFTDAAKAVDWFNKVAQFETLNRMECEGRIRHCELILGSAIVMIGDPGTDELKEGKRTAGLYISMKDDAALIAHFEAAKKQDPDSIDKEPYKTDYGSLDYSLKFENQFLYFGTYVPKEKFKCSNA